MCSVSESLIIRDRLLTSRDNPGGAYLLFPLLISSSPSLADAKDIPHHTIYVNLTTKPGFLFDHSPPGTVPAVQLPAENNQSIHESLVIAEYLDAKFPQRQLYPKCPFAKALDQLLIKKFEGVISAMYKVFVSPTPEPGAIVEIAVRLDDFEAELKRRGTQYFHGDLPGMVDYMIWPWCERADMLGYLIGDRYKLDDERFPSLVSFVFICQISKTKAIDCESFQMKWRELMKADKAVKQSFVSGEHHAKYMMSRREGMPDYDMLV